MDAGTVGKISERLFRSTTAIACFALDLGPDEGGKPPFAQSKRPGCGQTPAEAPLEIFPLLGGAGSSLLMNLLVRRIAFGVCSDNGYPNSKAGLLLQN